MSDADGKPTLPKIVGIGGRTRSGKDTVAEYLIQQHEFVRLAFSDELKREVERIFYRTLSIEAQRMYGHHISRGTMTLQDAIHTLIWTDRTPLTRCLLQEWGTDLRRAENPSYWIIKYVQAFLKQSKPVVTPDVRFPNEMRIVRQWGGVVVWVNRTHGESNPEVLNHPSEQTLTHESGWDAVFENEGTKEELYAQVEAFLASATTHEKLHQQTRKYLL